MTSPYDKAIRHAKECARRGMSVESCGYKAPTWRTAWLKAFEGAQQMQFDNFEDDIKTAEGKLHEHDNERSGIQGAHTGNGDTDTAQCQQEAAPAGKKYPPHELGLFDGISNDDYHRGPGISSTSLKYATKAMKLYHAYVTGKVSFQETEAMRLGTAVHKLCLEALDFSNEIVVSKKFGRTKIEQAAKAEFYAANVGKTVIDSDQYDQCRFMCDSLMALPDIGDIFADGKPEQSGFYVDRSENGDSTNMLCKYRPDFRTDWCLFDVKTTRDISDGKFSRTILDLGYHISAAHYLEGDRILKGTTHRQFIFGGVEPEPPYLACLYVLDDDSLQLGELKRRQALAGIRHGRDTEEWPEYNHGITTSIGVPGYAKYELERSKI